VFDNLRLANQINVFKLCQQIDSAPPSSTFHRRTVERDVNVADICNKTSYYSIEGLAKPPLVILNLFQDLGFKHTNDILDSDPPAGGQNDAII